MLCWYCNVCLAEHKPAVSPQSLSQAPQAWGQRKVPPEGTPAPHQAIPYEPSLFTPPPPVEHVPRGQPQQVVSPAAPAPGSSVAPGATGPSGLTPALIQAESSSPAPSGKIKGIEGGRKHLFFQIFQPLLVLLLLFMSSELSILQTF
jgi:hypothetical protein